MNKTTYTFSGDQALLLPENITFDESVRVEVYINGSRLSALDNIHNQGSVIVLPFYKRHADDVIEIDVYDVVATDQDNSDEDESDNTDTSGSDIDQVTKDTVSVVENSDITNNALLVASQPQRQGMDAKTGKLVVGIDHLKQSISDIILTPRGSRVMRRTYGSDLYLLKDQRMTSSTIMRIYSAVADALHLWEPRILLDRVFIDEHDISEGRLSIGLQWRITAAYRDQFPVANDDYYTQRLEAI